MTDLPEYLQEVIDLQKKSNVKVRLILPTIYTIDADGFALLVQGEDGEQMTHHICYLCQSYPQINIKDAELIAASVPILKANAQRKAMEMDK